MFYLHVPFGDQKFLIQIYICEAKNITLPKGGVIFASFEKWSLRRVSLFTWGPWSPEHPTMWFMMGALGHKITILPPEGIETKGHSCER